MPEIREAVVVPGQDAPAAPRGTALTLGVISASDLVNRLSV